MALRHLAYVGMLAFCLAGTLPLVPLYHLRVFSRPGRLLATIAVSGAPFLLWDVWATRAGHWHFDPEQTLPWRVLGLPLEEIAFFVVIPLVSILAYEGVRAARGDRDSGRPPRPGRAVP
ncbi:MAG TPA: lycopene cyclase domain-containing protein [Actinomycetales bacterium]|nr:lycopene cyclase domain-containing protein [Actinomycetales bacterium]